MSTLNYGMKEKKLARDLGISVEEATNLMEAYMDRYPAVKSYFEETVNDARMTGYCFTVLGRRRFLPDIISEDEMSRWTAERQAGNLGIQGSAADVVKMAMLRCFYEGDLERKYDCRMLLQIHDELMFECPPEAVNEVKPIVKEMMEHSLPTDLSVPLTVSIGVGKNWAETH
jgi:DNA polymerase-1